LDYFWEYENTQKYSHFSQNLQVFQETHTQKGQMIINSEQITSKDIRSSRLK